MQTVNCYLLFLLFIFLITEVSLKKSSHGPRVFTTSGIVQGVLETSFNRTVDVYLGIPFAEPPIGNLRFKKPIPKKPWKGTYKATTTSLPCLQRDMPIFREHSVSGENSTEDCLYLNVFTAARYCQDIPSCGPKPVLVFIYGGAFSFGGNSWSYYNASHLAVHGDLVVVVPNYRLGVMGFLNARHPDAPGNQGLWDQYLALEWVQKNIAFFGGDPDQVTIAGQSAGAGSVGLHIISPLTKGLFKRAIMASGSPYWKLPDNTKSGPGKARLLAQTAGCNEPDEDMANMLACLRKANSSAVLDAAKDAFGVFSFTFIPSYGDELLPIEPTAALEKGTIQKTDLLVSTVKNEGSAFVDFLLWKLFHTTDVHKVSLHNVELFLMVMMRYFLNINTRPIINKYLRGVNYNDSLTAFKAGSDLFGDYLFVCPVNYFAEAMAGIHDNVFYYQFSQRPTHNMFPDYFGTTHFDDCYFSIGTVFSDPRRWTFPERELSKDMMSLWGTFTRTGKPPSPFRGQTWPKYSSTNSEFVNISASRTNLAKGPHLEHCNFMKQYIK